MRQIDIVISPTGEVSIDLIGYKGDGCARISEALSKALGEVRVSDKKCEYYNVHDDERVNESQ